MQKKITLVLIVAMSVLLLNSCKKSTDTKITKYVPKDACFVGVIDGSYSSMFQNEEYEKYAKEQLEPIMAMLKGMNSYLPELFEQIQKDGNALGFNTSEKMLFFLETVKVEDAVFGLVMPINKKKLSETIEKIINGFDESIRSQFVIQEKNDIKYFENEIGWNSVILGYNNEVMMFLFNADIEKLENLMNLKSNQTINENKDFVDFYNDCKYFSLWACSDIIDKVAPEAGEKYEEITGMNIKGNYAHIYIDMFDNEFSITVKAKTNTKFKDMNMVKIMENLQKVLPSYGSAFNPYQDFDFDNDDFDFDYDDADDYMED